jgi:pimeloyl-ACP methyl ester carboxylesterase
MAHGLGLTRVCGLEAFAEAFAAAGYAVLLFDYRGFGDSGGTPRQLVSHRRQLEDWAAAIEFACSQPAIDSTRIVTWGFSLGGGHALSVAMKDERVAIVVAVAPMFDAISSTLSAMRRWSVPVFLRIVWRAVSDRIGSWLGRPATMVPLTASPGGLGLLTSPDAHPGYEAIVPDDFDYLTCARMVLTFWMYAPGLRLKSFTRDLLVLSSPIDKVNPPEPTVRRARRCRSAVTVELSCEHMEVAVEPHRTQVIRATLDFLSERLPRRQLEQP